MHKKVTYTCMNLNKQLPIDYVKEYDWNYTIIVLY